MTSRRTLSLAAAAGFAALVGTGVMTAGTTSAEAHTIGKGYRVVCSLGGCRLVKVPTHPARRLLFLKRTHPYAYVAPRKDRHDGKHWRKRKVKKHTGR
ncbi:MAG: hypothetical protein R3D33_18305 [Hyphomicrobiaceae bacterium]